MSEPESRTNVQQLCRIYEQRVVGQNLRVNNNNSNRSVTSVFYHAMFALTVIIIAVICATIVEHRRMLNIYWKTLLNIKLEILNIMILKENTILSFWKYLNIGEKAFGIVTAIHVGVYMAWNVTKWNSTMLKYFIITEDKRNSVWSLLLSAFSHTSLWRVTANVVYLYYPLCKLGFVRAWPISTYSPYMGIEEFFVMYISACLFSSLFRIYIEQKLSVSGSRHGASGAISAVFGYVAIGFPNRKLLTIPITIRDELSVGVTSFEALMCLMLLIIFIVFVLKCSWINSSSIISGCIFGIFWYKLGSKIIWGSRRCLMNVLQNNNVLESLYNWHIAILIDSDMFQATSLVMMIFYETIFIGHILFNVWRLFFDKQLSVVLTKLEGIHEKLIRLNVIRPMKIKMKCLFIFGILVHFIAFNMHSLYWVIISYRFTLLLVSMVMGLVASICICVAFYEYILFVLYIKWMVNTINEQIPKRMSTLSTFRDLYLEVIECLNDINGSIYGCPAIVNYIAANIGLIFYTLFYQVIFPEINNIKYHIIFDILILITRAVNIILLYGIGHATAKEINRMSIVLHQRSVIESNPRIKRQIKFFLLRRFHEHFYFELYGTCEINLRQLLILANKAIVYFVVQIMFQLNKK